ncbi:MAG TPA: hypothetical protein VFA12_20295 [Stellaceae bacterium]|nr:hypothetical protein [Stellaceae bacterium]
MAKILRNLRITEVSSVDRGAGEGVKVVLMKRDEKTMDIQIDAALAKIDAAGEADPVIKRTFTAQQRREYARSGVAMKDGSYPIANRADLERAIHAVGRGRNNSHEAIRRHIIARARALGATSMLPDDWNVKKRALPAVLEKFFAVFGVAKDGHDFDTVQAAVEAREYACGMLQEICEAVGSLRESVNSIMCDDELTDKQAALDETFGQFQEHVQGIVPEGIETAMAAAALVADGYTINPQGAVHKQEDRMTDLEKKLAETEAALAKARKDMDDEKAAREMAAREKESIEKALHASLEMPVAHRDYMNHPDQDMTVTEKVAFVNKSASERDEFIKAHPIAEKTEKRIASLPESVRKALEAGKAAAEQVQKLADEAVATEFAKRASDMGLGNDLVPHMIALHKAAPEAYAEIQKQLEALAAQVKAGEVFKEFGARGSVSVDDPVGKVGAVVAELQKSDGKLSKAKAIAKIATMPEHRDLWYAYKAATQGKRGA